MTGAGLQASTVGPEGYGASQADLSWHFADVASRVDFSDLGGDAVEAAKKSVLDLVGVSLAASRAEPAARSIIETVLECGGRPDATVLGWGVRVPAPMAALANGALAHSLDFDDLTPWGQHAGSSIVPAVLAVAERAGSVSGRNVIAAIAVGQDLFARLRVHVEWDKDWNLSTVFGIFAGTVAAGRVLGLSREAIQSAIGIATQQCGGVMEVVAGIGGDFRGQYAGFSAKGAVLSTLLADSGLTCVESPIEGPLGVLQTHFRGRYDREGILDDLGRRFDGGSTLYKRWPTVGTAHSHIHAILRLMDEHGLRAQDIEELRVHVGDYHQLMCTPLDQRCAPSTAVDARFSLPFLVASAAVRGRLTVGDLSTTGLRDVEVLGLARRVVPIEDSAYDWEGELPPGRVEVLDKRGRVFAQVGTSVPGSPDAPLTWEQLTAKFTECASAAENPPSERQIEEFVATIRGLEDADDATAPIRMLH